MIPAQVVFQEDPPVVDGLRSRKKLKTRHAIQNAALELFAEQGYEATTVDEIAARADVSTTTFFTYFPSKGEVIVSDHSQWVPALQQGILERPLSESDLVAVQRAIQEKWVAAIDLERTVRLARAISTSHVLRGLSYDGGQVWLAAITDALARRHDLDVPDDECWLTARIALTVLGHALQSWMRDDCSSDLGTTLDDAYEVMAELYAKSFG